MRSKKIYLIRHGETEYNKQGIVQGSGVDIGLNELGKKQASTFFEKYHELPFDKVYTSVLKRSIESVKGFLDLGIPHVAYSGLNEINWGNREGQKISIAENQYYKETLHQWSLGHTDLKIEGGESPKDVQARIKPVINEILEDNSTSQVLICMHGRSMRILLATLLNYPLHVMDMFTHTNLCLYTLQYTGSMCRIEDFNNTSHLSNL